MYCYNCGQDCIKEAFQLKILDAHLNVRTETCCSTTCCEQAKNKELTYFESRFNEVRYQSYNKLF